MDNSILIFLFVLFLEIVSIVRYLKLRNSDKEEDRKGSCFILVAVILCSLFIIFFILKFLGVE